MSIFSSLLSPFAKKWASSRISSQKHHPGKVRLTSLLMTASQTRFGQEFGFEEIMASRDPQTAFQSLPIFDYDTWVTWLGTDSPLHGVKPMENVSWPGVVDMFCLSSGTTSGRTKYVPYSQEMAQVNRRAALDMLAYMLRVAPETAPPFGRAFYMTGSTHIERNEAGALCGDMSGITKYLAPKILEKITLPPRSVSNIPDWDDRLEALVKTCLANRNMTSLSGIPIWQLTMLERIRAKAGKPISEVLPRLRFLIHGGMSMTPYRDQIRALVGDTVTFIEIYAASETGITAFTVPGEEGMRFWEQYQVYYEFEDDDGHVCTSDEIECNKPYSLIVSTCSGLWRYRIGDRVVFSSKDPLRLAYVTRDKTTSAFDEKVTEKQLENAMDLMTPSFADFSLGPDIENRRHIWFVLGDANLSNAWIEGLDDLLRRSNEDYDDYRGDGRIQPPMVVTITDRARFLKLLGREEGGQRKFPRLIGPEEVATLLDAFAKSAHPHSM